MNLEEGVLSSAPGYVCAYTPRSPDFDCTDLGIV